MTLAAVMRTTPITEYLQATALIVLYTCGNKQVNASLIHRVSRYNEFQERDKYYYKQFMNLFLNTTMIYSELNGYLGATGAGPIQIPAKIEIVIAKNACIFTDSCPNMENMYIYCKMFCGELHKQQEPITPLVFCLTNRNDYHYSSTDIFMTYGAKQFNIPEDIDRHTRMKSITVKSRCTDYKEMMSKIEHLQSLFPNVDIKTGLICEYRYCRVCSPPRVKRQAKMWNIHKVDRKITKIKLHTSYTVKDDISIAKLDTNFSSVQPWVTKLAIMTHSICMNDIFSSDIRLLNINDKFSTLHSQIEEIAMHGTMIDDKCDLSRFTKLRSIIMAKYLDPTVDMYAIAKKLMAKYPYLVVTIV